MGADARRVTSRGETALHMIAGWADREGDGGGVVGLLVAAGCDTAVLDNRGRTAVEAARDLHGAVWATKIEEWAARRESRGDGARGRGGCVAE